MDSKYALTTTVAPEEEGLMVKDIVYGRLQLSRGLIRRMKRGGGVYLNGQKDYLTRRVNRGDQLCIFFYDEPTTLKPEQIPLDVVYEDDFLLVVNKPAAMAVHPVGAYQEGTLANAIAAYWENIGLKTKVRLVHRIDKDTSGLVLVAKEPYSLQRLIEQLGRQTLIREYLALVEGRPEVSKGVISNPISRSLDHGVKRIVSSKGKDALTAYEVLCSNQQVSLLRIRLGSGRTHQIRVHLASLGHPLLGDALYNRRVTKELDRQALHAWRLGFVHPRSGRNQTITCSLPEDMLRIWKDIRRGKLDQ